MNIRCALGIHKMVNKEMEGARTRYATILIDEFVCERCGKSDADYRLRDWAIREAARMEQGGSISLVTHPTDPMRVDIDPMGR